MSDWKPVGRLQTALMLGIPALLFTLIVGVLMARCTAPDPAAPPTPVATPAASAPYKAESASAATASQSVKGRVVVRRPVAQPVGHSSANDPNPVDSGSLTPIVAPVASENHEEIVVEFEVNQAVGAAASSSVAAPGPQAGQNIRSDHGRLGVVILTAPGVFAPTYQLARWDVPPWVAGVKLQVGLEAEANLEQFGAGISVGDKGFAAAYGWSRWNLGAQGLALGVGLRF